MDNTKERSKKLPEDQLSTVFGGGGSDEIKTIYCANKHCTWEFTGTMDQIDRATSQHYSYPYHQVFTYNKN